MADFWDKETEPIMFEKNDRGEDIYVKKVKKKGREYIDVRTFIQKTES